MAQSTSNADSDENNDLRSEIQDIKSQLQTLLHALNLGTDRDQDQRPEGGRRPAGGERKHQGPAEPPTFTILDLDPVHVGDGDNATHPVALNNVLGVIVETQRQEEHASLIATETAISEAVCRALAQEPHSTPTTLRTHQQVHFASAGLMLVLADAGLLSALARGTSMGKYGLAISHNTLCFSLDVAHKILLARTVPGAQKAVEDLTAGVLFPEVTLQVVAMVKLQ
ncbi:hypothetical protein MTO96_050607 [Rhipicephalus appendiculatus]